MNRLSTLDGYAGYSASASNNYADTTTSSNRVNRGGDSLDGNHYGATALHVVYRFYIYPTYACASDGVRCARAVQ